MMRALLATAVLLTVLGAAVSPVRADDSPLYNIWAQWTVVRSREIVPTLGNAATDPQYAVGLEQIRAEADGRQVSTLTFFGHDETSLLLWREADGSKYVALRLTPNRWRVGSYVGIELLGQEGGVSTLLVTLRTPEDTAIASREFETYRIPATFGPPYAVTGRQRWEVGERHPLGVKITSNAEGGVECLDYVFRRWPVLKVWTIQGTRYIALRRPNGHWVAAVYPTDAPPAIVYDPATDAGHVMLQMDADDGEHVVLTLPLWEAWRPEG